MKIIILLISVNAFSFELLVKGFKNNTHNRYELGNDEYELQHNDNDKQLAYTKITRDKRFTQPQAIVLKTYKTDYFINEIAYPSK